MKRVFTTDHNNDQFSKVAFTFKRKRVGVVCALGVWTNLRCTTI